MIIVEGPEGSGKSTLISTLAEVLNVPVAPRVVSRKAEAMLDLREWVEQNLSRGPHRVIYDRHRLVSEPIYGSILREDMETGFDNLDWLITQQSRLQQLDPFVIYCLPPLDIVMGNIAIDPDKTVISAHIKQIYWLYHNFAAMPLWSWFWRWDYTDPRADQDALISALFYYLQQKGIK